MTLKKRIQEELIKASKRAEFHRQLIEDYKENAEFFPEDYDMIEVAKNWYNEDLTLMNRLLEDYIKVLELEGTH